MKIHAELVKLRDEGLFRFIGLTTHVAFETVYKLIATGGFDQTLLTICYFHKGMDTLLSERNRELREKCLDKARDLGMAVVAMKVHGREHLRADVEVRRSRLRSGGPRQAAGCGDALGLERPARLAAGHRHGAP